MLYAVILFLVLSVIAGVLGFTGVAVTFAAIGKILFYLFIVLFVISLISYVVRGRSPRI